MYVTVSRRAASQTAKLRMTLFVYLPPAAPDRGLQYYHRQLNLAFKAVSSEKLQN